MFFELKKKILQKIFSLNLQKDYLVLNFFFNQKFFNNIRNIIQFLKHSPRDQQINIDLDFYKMVHRQVHLYTQIVFVYFPTNSISQTV